MSIPFQLVEGDNITLTLNENGELIIASTGGGGGPVTGGSKEANPTWEAGKFAYPDTNPAPLNTRDITHGTVKEQLHDDTTTEGVQGTFRVPSDIKTDGLVNFKVFCSPVTAAAGRNVGYVFQHSACSDGVDVDQAFVSVQSGDKAVSASQDALSSIVWSESVANLGWSAGDMCRFVLSRYSSGITNNLSGDLGTWFFEVDIERTE